MYFWKIGLEWASCAIQPEASWLGSLSSATVAFNGEKLENLWDLIKFSVRNHQIVSRLKGWLGPTSLNQIKAWWDEDHYKVVVVALRLITRLVTAKSWVRIPPGFELFFFIFLPFLHFLYQSCVLKRSLEEVQFYLWKEICNVSIKRMLSCAAWAKTDENKQILILFKTYPSDLAQSI